MTSTRDNLASLRLLAQAANGSAADSGDHYIVRQAFERLRDGTADTSDFDSLVKAINTAKIRALEIGEQSLIDTMTAGQAAMSECRRRYMQHRKFGFSGPEIVDMLNAIDVYEAIASASSALQMEEAWRTSCRSVELNMKGKK